MPTVCPRCQPWSTGENWCVTVASGRICRTVCVSFFAKSASESSRKCWNASHCESFQSIFHGISIPDTLRNFARHASQQQIIGQNVISIKIPSTG